VNKVDREMDSDEPCCIICIKERKENEMKEEAMREEGVVHVKWSWSD